MGLKITYLDHNGVRGMLDGFFPFSITRDGDDLVAQVAGWKHVFRGEEVKGEAQMRAITYIALARYREYQRNIRREAGSLGELALTSV